MKTKTKAEKAYHAKVAELPCAACGAEPPSLVHHKTGAGMGLKASHWNVMPLCPMCHQYGKNAVHASLKNFTKIYGSQDEMIRLTKEQLGITEERI